jgi:hypothetical protein
MDLHDLASTLVREAERQIAAARADAQQAIAAATAERDALASALDDERRQRGDAEQQLKERSAAQAFADAARREAEAARDQEVKARQQEAKAREQESRARDQEVKARLQETQAREEEAAAREAAERELADERERARRRDVEHARERAALAKRALEPLDHLRSAFDRFRTAATIDSAIRALFEAMAMEFPRVAVFDVDADRLAVSHHHGFGDHDMSNVAVPLTMASPLTRAVKDGKVQGLTAHEISDGMRELVGGSPAFVLVLPVPVRGLVQAVVYADDAGETAAEASTPERRVRVAEILLWHTVPLLTRLALEEEALAEFREYAVSIVNDLESVYVADAAKHKTPELRKRLQLNLQYARRRFAERMQTEGATAARLLDEQLAAAIERKADTAFGKDLAAVS